jgi:hypothetical protein
MSARRRSSSASGDRSSVACSLRLQGVILIGAGAGLLENHIGRLLRARDVRTAIRAAGFEKSDIRVEVASWLRDVDDTGKIDCLALRLPAAFAAFRPEARFLGAPPSGA